MWTQESPGVLSGRWRPRPFAWLLGGQALTMTADVALTLALGVWIQQLTGSASRAGAVFVFFAVPSVVAPLAGPLVDSTSRKALLIWTDLVLSASALLLLMVQSASQIWLIYLTALIFGAGQQVTFAARAALVPDLVLGTQLASANGLIESLRQGLRILGPLVGTAALVGAGPSALALSLAGMLAASALLLLPLPPDRCVQQRTTLATPADLDPHRPLSRTVLDRMRAGLAAAVNARPVRQLIVVYSVAFGAAGLLEVSVFALVTVGLSKPSSFVAVLAAMEGVGALIAGAAVGPLSRWCGPFRLQIAALLALTTGMFILVVSSTLSTNLGAFALIGFGLVAFLVSYVTLIQVSIAGRHHGTVFLAAESAGNLPFVLCLAVGSALLTVAGYRQLLAAATVMLLFAIGLTIRVKRRRPSSAQP